MISENFRYIYLSHKNGYIKIRKSDGKWEIRIFSNGDEKYHRKERPAQHEDILDYTQEYREVVEKTKTSSQGQYIKSPHEIYEHRLETIQNSDIEILETSDRPKAAVHLFCSKQNEPLVDSVCKLPDGLESDRNPTREQIIGEGKYSIYNRQNSEEVKYNCISTRGWIEQVDSTYSDWRFPIERFSDNVINFVSDGLSYISRIKPDATVQLYVTLIGFRSVELAGRYVGLNNNPVIPRNIEGGYITEFENVGEITKNEVSSRVLITNSGSEIMMTGSEN